MTFSEYFNYHVGENANSMPSMQSIIERGLQAFRSKNNKLPGRVLLYSSGASEGALKAVVSHMDVNIRGEQLIDRIQLANDISEVKNAIAELYKGQPQPEVMYVLVCRSGTTRLFVEKPGQPAINVQPGTVVDDNICDSNSEFYLVSHEAGQSKYHTCFLATCSPYCRICSPTQIHLGSS